MRNNQEINEKQSNNEIIQMTNKIIQKFQIHNYSFAHKIAEELYKNGITLNKLTEENYKKGLNLEQIIYYLIQKEERKHRIIPFQQEQDIKLYSISRKRRKEEK